MSNDEAATIYKIVYVVCSIIVMLSGMYGLSAHIDYSGWVLAVGLLMLLS